IRREVCGSIEPLSQIVKHKDFMAERGGFEPPIALRLCLISSQVHSTGLCHLSVYCQRITGCSLDLFLPVSVVVSNLGKKMTPICLRRQRYAQGRDVNSA